MARREAAFDRTTASEDRVAAATDRGQAEHDRKTAWADRTTAADDRHDSAHDREAALSDRGFGTQARQGAAQDRQCAAIDRGVSATDRVNASLDALTGAYRRDAGLVELDREMARARRTGQPLVLAFLDVDRLKLVNDSAGHAVGDQLLMEVTETVKSQLRVYDLVMRYGGDEFICVLSGLEVAEVARRLELVNVVLAEAPIHGSVSAGIAVLQKTDTPEDLIRRADAALYQQRRVDTDPDHDLPSELTLWPDA